MKILPLLVLFFIFAPAVEAQRRGGSPKPRPAAQPRSQEMGQTAVIFDETLSVLRDGPSLFANAIQRMRLGRKMVIRDVKRADGVTFYRVTAAPSYDGWVQADAVVTKFRPDDESRFFDLILASSGFEQIEMAVHFSELFPQSERRPAILLLLGDLLEDTANKLSGDANRRLNRREMAATKAPLHSYYLNFVSLDRYRRLGIKFVFNSSTLKYHYDGESWTEIAKSFPRSEQAAEANQRLDTLKQKMEATAAKR